MSKQLTKGVVKPGQTWREFFKGQYLSYFDLIGADETVVIEKPTYEEVTGPGGRKENKLVIHFKGETLPMVVNVTNAKQITELYGTNQPVEWIGKAITLYADGTVTRGGEVVGGVRIRPTVPSMEKKRLAKADYDRMIEAIKSGSFDKQKALDSFALTPDQVKQINAL